MESDGAMNFGVGCLDRAASGPVAVEVLSKLRLAFPSAASSQLRGLLRLAANISLLPRAD